MDTGTFTYGFRVAGGPHEARKLVNWRKAFEAHCRGDLPTTEAYLSAWAYGPELVAHIKATGGVAGFSGSCRADWLPVDIDGSGSDPVGDALERTRRLLGWLESQGADLDRLACWFSGGKGFHVLLPTVGLGDSTPGASLRTQVRAFVERIGAESGAHPDLSIYDAVRIFRAPNTRHSKTGLYKVALRADELMSISADGVRRLARESRPGDPPEPAVWCDWRLGGELWTAAHHEANTAAQARPRAAQERTGLNRDTLAFIRQGAPPGERERRLFMAAANLAELGGPERLAVALLLEPAMDSGLSMSEAKRAIADGVRRGAGALP